MFQPLVCVLYEFESSVLDARDGVCPTSVCRFLFTKSGCCVTPPRLFGISVTIHYDIIRPASAYQVTSRRIDGLLSPLWSR